MYWSIDEKIQFLPSAPVRAIAVSAGPFPPELTADTLMTYIVKTVRLESFVLFTV